MSDTQLQQLHAEKSIVIVGMPGAGKTTIGRKLAASLDLKFIDADQEIETAAGMSIAQIFATLGEPAFRDGERKIISRLLQGPRIVLSTGGGAFMNDESRSLIKKFGLSLWLKADFDVLFERVSRSNDRPLLNQADPATVLQNLMKLREPVYAQADLTLQSRNIPIEQTVQEVLHILQTAINPPSN